MKWSVVAEAPDQLSAEMWRDLLLEEGVPARLLPGDTASYLGTLVIPCRVMVPQGREADAIAALSRRLAAEDLGPHYYQGDEDNRG